MSESNKRRPTDSDDPQEIETMFLESWNHVEDFFTRFFWGTPEWFSLLKIDPSELEGDEDFEISKGKNDWLKPIMGLIAEMRQHGYDRKFRAGQSMERFVLSRSRKHGLRPKQAAIAIDVHAEHGMSVSYWGAGEPEEAIKVEQERIALTPEVEQLLARLLEQPID